MSHTTGPAQEKLETNPPAHPQAHHSQPKLQQSFDLSKVKRPIGDGKVVQFLDNATATQVTRAAAQPNRNFCIFVMGYTGGKSMNESAGAKEMRAVMDTWGYHNPNIYYVLDKYGGDNATTAQELCQGGGVPKEQCIFLNSTNCPASNGRKCLPWKISALFEERGEFILDKCDFFMRSDSDQYLYVGGLELHVLHSGVGDRKNVVRKK